MSLGGRGRELSRWEPPSPRRCTGFCRGYTKYSFTSAAALADAYQDFCAKSVCELGRKRCEKKCVLSEACAAGAPPTRRPAPPWAPRRA